MRRALPDLLSLSPAARWVVLCFVVRLLLRKRISRRRLPWPAAFAARQAALAFAILVIIPVPLRAGAVLAVYGSALCLALLLTTHRSQQRS